MPLISVEDMIGSVKASKAKPQEKILVSGVIGWLDDMSNAKWRIDKDSTSQPAAQQNLWDYMPICSLPNVKSADNNIYKAYGGLRLKKFIDGFDKNGATFSICSNDFTPAMTQIGNAIAKKLKPGCVTYPLIDTDPSTDIVEPECQVTDEQSCNTPGQNDCLPNGYKETPLRECKNGSGSVLNPANPDLNSVPDDDTNRPCWYLVYDKDPNAGCPDAYKNQKITALRRNGTAAPAGTLLSMKCLTCARSDGKCPGLGLEE
jgi:hypothetical protein